MKKAGLILSGLMILGLFSNAGAVTRTVWNTTYKIMTLWQDGTSVTGKYNYDSGELTGSMNGNIFTGFWREEIQVNECGPGGEWSGPVVFEFSTDGTSFTGTWDFCDLIVTAPWTGTRVENGSDNGPPDKPVLLSPSNTATETVPAPLLTTGTFSDADPGDFHEKTIWQISTNAVFSSTVLEHQSTTHLTSFSVPSMILEGGRTYYWRVRFYDNHSNGSIWSDAFSFTTTQDFPDVNDNGIPDHLENQVVDLDNDGIPDSQQTDMIKSLNTVIGDGQMGISRQGSATVTELTAINSVDPDMISVYARPHTMPLGMLSFRLKVNTPGDTAHVTVYFSEAAPVNAAWLYHDPVNGWEDYSQYVSFSLDRRSAIVELKDGGHGDADGTANGIIVDPCGFGIASWLTGNITDATSLQGISNAKIWFPDINLNLNTLPDGKYLTMLLPGIYSMTVTKAGYESSRINNINIAEADILTKNLELPGNTRITGLQVIGTPSLSAPVTCSVNAESSGSPINYRYSIRSGYGTSAYDQSSWQSMTPTEYQTDSSCSYTFKDPGKSIIVVWATAADLSAVNPNGVPIIGWAVDTNVSGCTTHFAGISITGNQKTGKAVTFMVHATHSCNRVLYYRFSLKAHYGTDQYEASPWESMTDSEWVSASAVDYTFAESGKYIVVVWVTDDPGNASPKDVPTIGWSVDIE